MQYRIKSGYSFLDADGFTKTGGDTIDLSDESAALHADKIEPCVNDADVGADVVISGDTSGYSDAQA